MKDIAALEELRNWLRSNNGMCETIAASHDVLGNVRYYRNCSKRWQKLADALDRLLTERAKMER